MAKKKVNVTPLGDRVLIKPEDPNKERETESGIIIPDTASKEKPERGEVVAVGSGKTLESGAVKEPSVEVGDTVVFTKYSPDEVTVDDETYLVVKEDSLLAVIND